MGSGHHGHGGSRRKDNLSECLRRSDARGDPAIPRRGSGPGGFLGHPLPAAVVRAAHLLHARPGAYRAPHGTWHPTSRASHRAQLARDGRAQITPAVHPRRRAAIASSLGGALVKHDGSRPAGRSRRQGARSGRSRPECSPPRRMRPRPAERFGGNARMDSCRCADERHGRKVHRGSAEQGHARSREEPHASPKEAVHAASRRRGARRDRAGRGRGEGDGVRGPLDGAGL